MEVKTELQGDIYNGEVPAFTKRLPKEDVGVLIQRLYAQDAEKKFPELMGLIDEIHEQKQTIDYLSKLVQVRNDEHDKESKKLRGELRSAMDRLDWHIKHNSSDREIRERVAGRIERMATELRGWG